MLSFLKQSKTSMIARRCAEDEWTRLRLKYRPYYHTFSSQNGSRVTLDGREMVMLSSNDYLGLSFDPKVIRAAQQGVSDWGTSPTGARLSNGSRAYHYALEEKLASFLGKEACHVSVAGYLSCMSAIQAFAQKGDLIVADKNVHSSLMAGAGLTQARVERFAHNNADDLADILRVESSGIPLLLVLEGVYSMEGHITQLPDLLAAAESHNPFVVLDDAHGFGVLGEQGRGTAAHFGLSDKVDLICGSFSKALSSTGGFVAGSRDAIEYLRTHAKQMIFSAALPPAQAYAASASLDILMQDPEPLARLWENTRTYKRILQDLGLDIWESETPAVPIILGSKERAYCFWRSLMDKGVFTVMSTAPAVPPGKDLVRTAISARHSGEDMEIIADAMAYAAKRL